MNPQMIKLLGLSALTAGILAAASGARADEIKAPTFTAEPCCNLCPEARDPKNYTTRYQQNFTTLVQAQGDWLFRTQEDLRTEFNTTPAGYQRLQQLHDAFKKKGVELVLVYQPTRGLVNRNKLNPQEKASFDYEKALGNYKTMLGRFAQMGYVVPDLSPLTNENLPETLPAHDFYFRGDQHWTPYGAQRTAKIVAEKVKQLPAFADIPKREFETKRSGRMGKTGTLHNMAGQLCGTSYAIQYMDQFTTEPKGEAGDGDLFGDSGNPQITLVGTSHSGKNYNFAGFLEEAIGADILNVAFPGGGFEGAMIQYLGSEEFQKNPPKILIWEFSPLYRLDQETIYRQMFALLDNNGCEGKPALMSSKTALKPGKNELMVNSKNMDLRNSSHQVDIRFADTSVKTLHATLWYMNGRHEDIKIEKPDTSETDGRFAFQLRTDEDWASQTLLAVEVEGPEAGAAPQQVEAKVCKRNASVPTEQTAQIGQ
ncbi:alginate O-acetyltransferase [Pseudomonas sp. RGM2987]|uniref:alginate O-acetyltransferase n=1 Tax=Pseudomonas sp. RGM2987 TaxID=2930090 RepID=UPI001FD66134|nr:alginate O-acetyltransferase [Pseudomonas sp. RGM2987]MCJ8206354.1 alginate O-acetyltransferase [Pseudomonas sp. RGM2987]